MAIHNQIILYGQITELPRIIKKDDGSYVQGSGSIVTMSGQRTVDIEGRKSKLAKISHTKLPVVSGNPDVVEIMDKFKVGDIVFIKGNIITRNFTKRTTCKSCGSPYTKQGVITFINPIHVTVEKSGMTIAEGEEYLKNYQEVSNVATIIGTLCRDPEITASGQSSMIVKFPLAIDRKYFIADDNPETRTDYPFVQVYGKQTGQDVLKRCRTGTVVFIDGTIQFRKYNKMKFPCQNPDCNSEVDWTDWALDIVPYALEYLSGWKTDEDIEKEQQESAEAALKSIGINKDENEE